MKTMEEKIKLDQTESPKRSRIYLGGPAEQKNVGEDDDPKEWRNTVREGDDRWRVKLKTEYNYIDFIDPVSFDWDIDKVDYKNCARCIREVMLSQGIIIKFDEYEFTCGTFMEQFYAFMLGKPVCVWTDMSDNQLPQFMAVFSDYRSNDIEELIRFILRVNK